MFLVAFARRYCDHTSLFVCLFVCYVRCDFSKNTSPIIRFSWNLGKYVQYLYQTSLFTLERSRSRSRSTSNVKTAENLPRVIGRLGFRILAIRQILGYREVILAWNINMIDFRQGSSMSAWRRFALSECFVVFKYFLPNLLFISVVRQSLSRLFLYSSSRCYWKLSSWLLANLVGSITILTILYYFTYSFIVRERKMLRDQNVMMENTELENAGRER